MKGFLIFQNIHLPKWKKKIRTFPILPALPIICLYVNALIGFPANNGDRIITLRAGKLTPELNVLVAIMTRRDPFPKALSMMSRSSNVSPA